MADEAKRQAQLEAGRKKLETFKARKSLLKQQQQQQQQQQKEKEKKEEGETTIQTTTTTTPKRDEIFEQQRQQEEFHTPNALVSSSSSTIYDDSKTKTNATTTMVMQDEIEKIVREAVEKESAKLKRKFEEDVDELKQKHEEAREETEKEKKEFEDLKMEEMRKRMEEEKENFQTQSTERINELQEKVQKAVKKGKSMQAERDEIKSAFDALTTQSEELVKTIEIANERSGNAEKELGETKIQLQAKEKEFADLKSFYEENNASNLNEEERLKMELNEANANMQLVREEVETLKKKLTEQDERSLAAANEQHSEQIQLLQATIAEARDEGNRERVVAESLKQELDAKVSEVQKMKIEIEHSAEKLEEINAEKEMFMSECEKALESFDREKAKAKELKQKLKDFDHESKTSAQMKMEEHENALRAASERATFLEEELSKANAALTQASENVQRGPSAEELEREKQEQQRELHELKSRLDQELQGMNVLREQLQEERGKRAQLDARLAASLAAQQQQATTTQHTGASEQKQPSPHHRFTNKKNEDYGDDDDETMLNDIEGAIISGGSYSFVPLQGKFKSLTFCPPLQSSGCLQAANMFDRFSVFLQRRPTLRVLLIGYFALLHVLLFLF